MKLDAVAGAEVCIRRNGVALREYDDEAYGGEDQLKGVKYVEALSGSNFTVSFGANSSHLEGDYKDSVACAIVLDGKWICTKILDVYSHASYLWDIPGRSCVIDGQRILQRFSFGMLETSKSRYACGSNSC